MSQGSKKMCNTSRGANPSEGDPLVRGTFWKRFNQREVNGQDQESIPRPDNSHSHQGMQMLQGLWKHTLTLATGTNHMLPPLGTPSCRLPIHFKGKRWVQQPWWLPRCVFTTHISIQIQNSRNRTHHRRCITSHRQHIY